MKNARSATAGAGSLIVAALLISSASANASELCQAKQVRRLRQIHCSASLLPFRSGDEIGTIEVATVATRSKPDFDLVDFEVVYVVRQDGKYKRLKSFPFFVDNYQKMAGALGFAAFNVVPSTLYENKFVEVVEGRYCAVYVARFPFAGELIDCGNPKWDRNRTVYAQGMIRPAEARTRICSLVEAETGQVCGSNAGGVYSNELVRRDDGELTFQLMARLLVRTCPELTAKTSYGWTTPADYDVRIYEISPKGEVALVKQSRTGCQRF